MPKQKTQLIKVYHSYDKWRKYVEKFFDDIWKTLEHRKIVFWLNNYKWEIFYSFTSDSETFSAFESQFYTHFNDFQIVPDNKWTWNYEESRTVVWELLLENSWFFPFKYSTNDSTDFIFNIFRSFENFDIIKDKFWIYFEVEPLLEESFTFWFKSKKDFFIFKFILFFKFFKYMFNHKITNDWKKVWKKYFNHKLNKELFKTKIYIVMQWENKSLASGKLRSIFNNFLVFKNYPLNHFNLKIHKKIEKVIPFKTTKKFKDYILSSEEISSIFHYPINPKNETSLLKVTARKLALPIWAPIFEYTKIKGYAWIEEVVPKNYPRDVNIVWTSDYRSIQVPIWIHDEDRLRHLYILWKTWTGKSRFLTSLMIDDLKQWKGLWVIDPHGDLIEDIMAHIPKSRMKDVVIFDPTDAEFPFCFNPLDIKSTESKQVLAKWFIDIFKKFFGANWNAKLEHVLRMIFLALLDKPNATLFDIIRALTDKDFRYEMIDVVEDDVVRNFWTNEFAGWSQQFNTDAIMPILNKVGQLLSIDILKNIFASHENKLDFRDVMDTQKILLIKLPKWKLQEEIMWFLGSMFVTKIFQTAMWRTWTDKKIRVPFFLYVDEFQNFATETFSEILSEARKYWLSLTVAHQFISQMPKEISNSLFWNVWTLISFRISSEDAIYMAKHFDPFLNPYDLANLNMREFYCKLLVKGQVKDPFSVKSLYVPDANISKNHIEDIYNVSRKKYSRSLAEAKKEVTEEHKDVIETVTKVSDFSEPLI